jgi:predicted Zn finger-like uncharacterized protein
MADWQPVGVSMRLVCPNCAAQYEVDASVLPPDGTEVQCSACATVWFQPGPASATKVARPDPTPVPAEPPTAPAHAARPPAPAPQPAPPEPPRPNRPERAEIAAPRPKRPDIPAHPAPRPSAAVEKAVSDPPVAPVPPPTRALDPAVADVLRGEAEFEAKQRAREGNALETQQELGLFGPAIVAPASKSGAASLPDIDDISSTLEPIEAARSGQSELPQTEAARKRGFLAGMIVPLAMAAILTALYLLAPMLAGAVPALEGMLSAYVAMVDTARLAVAGLLGGGS